MRYLLLFQYILLPDAYSMPEHPESFPVNALVPIKGTPMENNEVGVPSVPSAGLGQRFLARFSSCASPYDRHRKNRSSDDDHPACGG